MPFWTAPLATHPPTEPKILTDRRAEATPLFCHFSKEVSARHLQNMNNDITLQEGMDFLATMLGLASV
jgi:hypothetical protein